MGLHTFRKASSVALAAAVVCFSGCTVGPNYQRPTSAPPTLTYRELPPPPGTWQPAVPADAMAKGGVVAASSAIRS